MRSTALMIIVTAVLLVVSLAAPALASVDATGDASSEYQLDNGLRVALLPTTSPMAKHVCVLVLYRFGGDHDPEGASGLGHLCEHLYVTAPAGKFPRRNVVQYMRRYPAGSNAQTGDDYTVIAHVVAPAHLENELEESAARMFELKVEQEDLDRELPRLQQEIENMFERVVPLASFNQVRQRVRPTVAGGRRGGEPTQVRSISIDTCAQRIEQYYKPVNATLVICGAFDVTTTKKQVAKFFERDLPGKRIPDGRPSPSKPNDAIDVVRVTGRSEERVLSVGYPLPKYTDPLGAPALIVASRLLRVGAGNPHQLPPDRVLASFLPIDDPHALILRRRVSADETPEEALAAVRAFMEAQLRALIPNEGQMHQMLLSPIFAAGPMSYQARNNPYGAAFAHARFDQWHLDPNELLQRVTQVEDLQPLRELWSEEKSAAVLLESTSKKVEPRD